MSYIVGQSKRRPQVDLSGSSVVREAELLVNLVTARVIVVNRLGELRGMGVDYSWAADQYLKQLAEMDELIEELRGPTA